MAPLTIPAPADPSEAMQLINAYAGPRHCQLPEYVDKAVNGYFASPVDRMAAVAEAIYAWPDEVDAAGLTLAAQLTAFCARWGFHGIGQPERAAGVLNALRRRLGDPSVKQKPEADPEKSADHLPPPPEPEPTPEPTLDPVEPAPAETEADPKA